MQQSHKPKLIRVSYFLWVFVLLALYAISDRYGTPHVIWRYEWSETGSEYDPYARRHYISCTYWGRSGLNTIAAQNGHCPLIRWFDREIQR